MRKMYAVCTVNMVVVNLHTFYHIECITFVF